MKKPQIALLLSALAVLPLNAIELSLEENRAERGNIGYIDMKRVFVLFPETQRARESFEEAVRQAEEGVNTRKAELLRLKAEAAALKVEREALAKTPLPTPPPAPVPAPLPVPAPVPAKAPPAAKTLVTPLISTGPAMAATELRPELDALLASTRAAVGTLPGFAGSSKSAPEMPGGAAGAPVEPPAGAKTGTPSTEPEEPAPAATVPTAVPQAPAGPAPAQIAQVLEERTKALQDLDDKVALKLKELSLKEVSFREHQASAEKNLLDLESRKSEILLGKIHKAVQEVARKEGVSVVVDKGSILYGHNAVDLTDKVLRHLKGV